MVLYRARVHFSMYINLLYDRQLSLCVSVVYIKPVATHLFIHLSVCSIQQCYLHTHFSNDREHYSPIPAILLCLVKFGKDIRTHTTLALGLFALNTLYFGTPATFALGKWFITSECMELQSICKYSTIN